VAVEAAEQLTEDAGLSAPGVDGADRGQVQGSEPKAAKELVPVVRGMMGAAGFNAWRPSGER